MSLLFDTDLSVVCLSVVYMSLLCLSVCYACLNYVSVCLSRRMVFKKDKDRSTAAQLIKDEAKKLSNIFLRLSHATNPKVRSCVS